MVPLAGPEPGTQHAMTKTTQPDPVAAAQEAAARAADATADAYRALAVITRQLANPQGEAMPWDQEPEAAAAVTVTLTEVTAAARAAARAADPDPSLEAFRAALEGEPAPAEPAPVLVNAEPTEEATDEAVEEDLDTDLLIAAAATPDPTAPLTAEQQAQARAWVGAMASAAQRKAFAAAFRHAFNVDPAEKSVAPLITQWQHYAFVDRFVIEAAGGVAA